jgi:hypothetical protein
MSEGNRRSRDRGARVLHSFQNEHVAAGRNRLAPRGTGTAAPAARQATR